MTNRLLEAESPNYLLYCYMALLVWAPLPLGSNRVWAWSLLEIGAFGLFALWIISYLFRPYKTPPVLKEVRVPLVLMCLWLCFMLFQAAPLSPETVKSLSPNSYSLYASVFGDQLPGSITISVDRHATLVTLLKGCAYTIMLFLTFMLITSASRLNMLVKVLVFVGTFEALYGLFNTLTGFEHIWWTKKTAYLGVVTGTFINRNHFAGLLELAIPFGLAMVIINMENVSEHSDIKVKIRAFISFLLGKNGLYTFFLMSMFAALFLSTSRAAISFFFVALAISILFSMIFGSNKSGRRGMNGAVYLVLLISVLAVAWLGLGQLPERAGQLKWHFTGRVATWDATLQMANDYKVLGAGGGTYEHVMTRYEDRSGPETEYNIYDHAHNDYLEILAEQGVVGLSLATLVTLLLFFKIAVGFAKRRSHYYNAILFASFTGCVSLLLHALVDFNFQIPSNALYFYVVLAIGVIASTIKSEKQVKP